MGSVLGESRETLVENLECIWPVTIDYTTHTLYWVDTCEYVFQSLTLTGDRESHSYPFDINVYFVNSVAMFKDNLYWVEPTGIYTIQFSGEGYENIVRSSSTRRPLHVQVVHPSQQPPGTQYTYIQMVVCSHIHVLCSLLCL